MNAPLNMSNIISGVFGGDLIVILFSGIVVILISILLGTLLITKKNLEEKLGLALSDRIFSLGSALYNLGRKCVSFLPNTYKRLQTERKFEKILNEQVLLLSNPNERVRRSANQQIINILSSPLGIEVAIKCKIHCTLISELSSDLEDTRNFAIQNLTRIINNADKKRVVSSTLIKELIKSLSDDREIKSDSILLLRLIIANRFGELFVNSIDNIEDPSVLLEVIHLLRYTLEIEDKDSQLQLKIFLMLKMYLESDYPVVKRLTLVVLEYSLNERVSDLIIEVDLIPYLLDLLICGNRIIEDCAQRTLIKIGKISMLPEIIEAAKQREESLPPVTMSCLICETISSNNCGKLIDVGSLEEIFKYLFTEELPIQARICASDSFVRFLSICMSSSRKKDLFLEKLTALNINNQLKALFLRNERDSFDLGRQILLALIRNFGKDVVNKEEIIDSLIPCCFNGSSDVCYDALKIIELFDVPDKTIIYKFCRLGFEGTWREQVAERLAQMIYNDRHQLFKSLLDEFESGLTTNDRILFEPLKRRICERIRELSL